MWKNVTVFEDAQIRGAVICDFAVIGQGSSVFEQSVIGTKTVIGKGATIKPAVKIWPQKRVDDGSTVNENIVWGNQKLGRLFGEYGVSGSVSTDVLPELASKLGTVFAGIQKGGKIAISSDATPSAVMLRMAAMSGLLSGGAQVFDFGEQPLPITRAGVKFYGLDGGIHISGFSGIDEVDIVFINKMGANVDAGIERKLEQGIAQGDFKRCEPDVIKEVNYLYEYKLFYLRELINSVKSKNIGYKILLASECGWAEKILSSAMKDLGCSIDILKEDIEFLSEIETEELAEKVRTGGYNFGAILDNNLEKMLLIDDKGNVIDEDLYKVLAALIVMKQYKNAEIVASVSTSGGIDILAEEYGARVVRTKNSPLEVMGCLCRENTPPEMQEQFVLNFDAVGALIKIIDFLNTYKMKLSDLYKEIPKFYMAKREVECSFEDKGRVMRHLVSEQKAADTTDGVKINTPDGWALILPDSSRPVFKIVSESAKEEYADEICALYNDRICEILKEK